MQPYENRVLECYRNCLAGGGTVTSAELLYYCNQIPKFAVRNDNTKQHWVWRFVRHYYPIVTQEIQNEATEHKTAEKEVTQDDRVESKSDDHDSADLEVDEHDIEEFDTAGRGAIQIEDIDHDAANQHIVEDNGAEE